MPCYGANGATMNHTCRACGSERIAPAVRVAPEAPARSLLAQLRARVCADCGYTDLFTDDAVSVFLAHQRAVAAAPTAEAASNLQCPRCGSVIPAASATCEACGWSPEPAA